MALEKLLMVISIAHVFSVDRAVSAVLVAGSCRTFLRRPESAGRTAARAAGAVAQIQNA
jgi:hypothetical protein